MGKVILYIAISLDGYIATADGSVDWLEQFGGDDDYGYGALMERVGSVVMGGKTYRQVLTFGDYPYAQKNSYILTKATLENPPHPNIVSHSGDIPTLLGRIRAESSQDIWLVGGAQVNTMFAQADAIDEYHIATMPILLGGGISLFEKTSVQQALRLTSSKSYETGVVMNIYERAR